MEKTLKARKYFNTFSNGEDFHPKVSPGDDEVLLPASLLGHQVDVPVEDCHQHAHLDKSCAKIFKTPHHYKTDHKATDEADKANSHAILTKQALKRFIFKLLLVGQKFCSKWDDKEVYQENIIIELPGSAPDGHCERPNDDLHQQEVQQQAGPQVPDQVGYGDGDDGGGVLVVDGPPHLLGNVLLHELAQYRHITWVTWVAHCSMNDLWHFHLSYFPFPSSRFLLYNQCISEQQRWYFLECQPFTDFPKK